MIGIAGVLGRIMSAAAALAHRNTTIDSAQLLDEGKYMMAHVKVVDRWNNGKTTPIPPDAKVRTHSRGRGSSTHFSQPCT